MKINKLTNFIAVLTLTLLLGATAFGQLAGWDTSALSSYGPSPFASTTTAANVTVGGLTRGSGVGTGGSAASRAWGGNTWSQTTAADGITNNQFFTFSIKANTGYEISLSSLDPFDVRRSSSGPDSILIQYQVNSGTFNNITTVTSISSNNSGASIGPINLSAITALQNIPASTTITFRVVPFGATSTTGTFYIFDKANTTDSDLAINGTVAPLAAGEVFVGGRVMSDRGMPIGNAVVTLSGGALTQPRTVWTSGFGYFSFRNVSVGNTYLITVTKDRFNFDQPTQVINLSDEENGLLFTGTRFFGNR